MQILYFLPVVSMTLFGQYTLATNCNAGITVVALPGSSYSANSAAMDSALGISGFLIEDFEDTVLIPGLTISFEGGIGTDKSYTVLTKTFDSASDSQTANNFWDGTKVLTNAGDGLNGPFQPSASTFTTFTLATAALVVGIGLANFQSATRSSANLFPVTDHSLFVNGQNIGTVEALAGSNWSAGIELRNSYVRIEGTNGELISSIRFRNDSAQDFLVFDRSAVFATQSQAVPEPTCLAVFGLGCIGFSSMRQSRFFKCSFLR